MYVYLVKEEDNESARLGLKLMLLRPRVASLDEAGEN